MLPKVICFCLLHVTVNACRDPEVRVAVNNITSAPSLVKIGSLIYTFTLTHRELPSLFFFSLSRKGSWPDCFLFFTSQERVLLHWICYYKSVILIDRERRHNLWSYTKFRLEMGNVRRVSISINVIFSLHASSLHIRPRSRDGIDLQEAILYFADFVSVTTVYLHWNVFMFLHVLRCP